MGICDAWQPPERGMHSEKPSTKWQEALISGNGKMGILVFGNPYKERIVVNHEKLYEPLLDEPCPVPDLRDTLPHVRELILAGKYREAYDFSYDYAVHEQGFPGIQWTDPYHPAFSLLIEHDKQIEVKKYTRNTNFSNGEITVRWKDDQSEFVRCSFVSRPKNSIVTSIRSTNKQPINCTLRLVKQENRSGSKQITEQYGGVFEPVLKTTSEWMQYRCKYKKSKRGYEGLFRVITKGGSASVINNAIKIDDAKEVLIIGRVNSLEDFNQSLLSETKNDLQTIDVEYDALLQEHASIHGEIFNRVSLDLYGGSSRDLSSEKLADQQIQNQPDSIIPAYLEKMFDMGRYAFICASGDWPPNLMGIWNGEWRPTWSGDFTLDANINLQISAANIGNMLEGMESYTNLILNLVDDWKINAKNYYGCRGVMSGTRTDGRHNLHTHFSPHFSGHFWTAGAQWLTLPMYEYYQVTGDREYLKTKLLPLMKEIALFYEDFLSITDENGKYVFVPSYSPENAPSNTRCSATINAAMDIACAREAFTNLIHVCKELNMEKDSIPKWKKILEKLPPYLVNEDGAFKEWAHPDLHDRYNHRHVSHLYPVWPGHEINPEETPELFKAAKEAARRRGRGNGSAHGLAHMALIGTRLKDADLVYGNLLFILKNGYILPSLFTYHNPGRIYNSDMLCSLPAVVLEMLVYSRPGVVELLPALSDRLSKGSVKGVLCRGGITIDEMKWNVEKKQISLKLHSIKNQQVKLQQRKGIADIHVIQDIPAKRINETTVVLNLPKDDSVTIELTFQ
jgi:alpha-L-fucosidase 2